MIPWLFDKIFFEKKVKCGLFRSFITVNEFKWCIHFTCGQILERNLDISESYIASQTSNGVG